MSNKKHVTKQKQLKKEQRSFLQPSLAFVLLLTLVVYFPSLKNTFVSNWDDGGYIIANEMIRNISWKSIVYMFTHFHLGTNYHPLTTLTNAIEFHFFGLNPQPYHFNNLILHLLNTALVFYFIKLLIKNKNGALLAALLFGIHPMHVESVAWVSERKDILYTTFFLTSLIFYVRFITEGKNKLLIWSVLLMLLSCLSKPAAVTLTPVLFLLDYFFEKKITWQLVVQKIPFLLLSVLFGVLAIISQKGSGSMNMVENFPFTDRIFFGAYGLAFYLVKAIVPVNLSAMYLYPQKMNGWLPVEYYLSPLLLIGLIAIMYKSKKLQKDLLFGLLFYLFTIALVIQIIPVGKAIVADRYSYVPYIGLFFIVAKIYKLISEGEPILVEKIKPAIINISLIAFVLFFSVTTWNRTKDWLDSYTLFSDMIKKQPDNYYAYYLRGSGLSIANNYADAAKDYSSAIKLDPSHDFLWYNRATMLENIDKKAAEYDYTEVIKLNPQHYNAYYNRGNIRYSFGNLNGAIRDYSDAIKTSGIYKDSTYAKILCNRGAAYLNTGDSVKAFNDFNVSLEQNPKLVNARIYRGVFFISKNDINSACSDFSAVLENQQARSYYDFYCKNYK